MRKALYFIPAVGFVLFGADCLDGKIRKEPEFNTLQIIIFCVIQTIYFISPMLYNSFYK